MPQHITASLLLVALLTGLAWRTIRSRAEMARFKLIADSAERRATFRKWTLMSFLGFTGASLAVLALLGRLGDLLGFPPEFAALARQWGITPDALSDIGPVLAGLAVGMAIGGIGLLLVWRFVFKQRSQPVIGDVGHLFPRNAAEAWTLIPLAINAGLSEEVFFRLALPVVGTLATGSALAGFVIAGLAFGLAHWYQGWRGMLLITLLSAAFTNIYLAAGTLLVPIIIHAAVDLLALVIRPAISLWLDGRVARKSDLAMAGGNHGA